MYFNLIEAAHFYVPAFIAVAMLHAALTDRVGAFLRVSGAAVSALALASAYGGAWCYLFGGSTHTDLLTDLCHFSALFFMAQLVWFALVVAERFRQLGRMASDLPPAR